MLHAGWQTNNDRRWTHTTIPQLPLASTTHYLHSAAQSPPPPVSSYLFSQPSVSSAPIALTTQSAYQQTAYFPLSSSLPLHSTPTSQRIVQHQPQQQQQAPLPQAQSAGFFHRLGSHFSSLLPFSFSLPFPLHSLHQQQQQQQQQQPAQPQQPSSLPAPHAMARRDSRYVSHTSHYQDTLAPPSASHSHHHHSTHGGRHSPSRSSSATSSIHSNSTYSSRGSHHPRSNHLTPAGSRRGEHRHHDRPHRHRRTPSASMRTASVGSEGRKEDQEGLIKINPGEYLHHGRCQHEYALRALQ